MIIFFVDLRAKFAVVFHGWDGRVFTIFNSWHPLYPSRTRLYMLHHTTPIHAP